MTPFTSIPGVVDITVSRGAQAPADAAPDLVIEVPHGATRTTDFTSLQALLKSPLPASLVDFFHVNTDAGAPELAEAVASRVVAAMPARAVAVLRCRVPRTFIDCNRRIDAAPEDFKAGKVTPGLMPWITDPDDRALLRARYDAYSAAVRAAVEAVMPRGAALMMHTYAPRTVDVEVDAQIVKSLRRAYEPDVEPTWPMRPEVDVIGRSVEGVSYAPAPVVDALREALSTAGIKVADSETYPMHPSTMAWHYATTWVGRTLCLEVRRDLVADPFEPFAEMRIGAEKVARLAGPIAQAVAAWW
ncbi:MAG: N-formylglutamate amidohydrolase [Polyangiales bacterium]